MHLGTMERERVAYAVTVEGVVWQYSGVNGEPRVLRFPTVEVGCDAEESWCALAQLAHVGITLTAPPIDGFAVTQSRGPRMGRKALRKEAPVVAVELAKIDLVEEGSDFLVQPLLELPASVPTGWGNDEARAVEEWLVAGLMGAGLSVNGFGTGISYAVFAPGSPARAMRGSEGVGEVAQLALVVGDLSSKHGWGFISRWRFEELRSSCLGRPVRAGDPALSQSACAQQMAAVASGLQVPGAGMAEERGCPGHAQWAALWEMGPDLEVDEGPLRLETLDPGLDYSQLSVDTMEVPQLFARITRRRRGTRGTHRRRQLIWG